MMDVAVYVEGVEVVEWELYEEGVRVAVCCYYCYYCCYY